LSTTIKIRRGLKSALPAAASLGELLFCTDVSELWIGTGTGIEPVVVVGAEGLATEVTRAETAEGALAAEIATVVEAAVVAETARAEAAESGLAAATAAERTRALAAEALAASLVSVTAAVAVETARAAAAEAVDASAVSVETARAEAEETILAAAIAAEVTRAEAAESAVEVAAEGFATAAVAALVNSAPALLDTLGEIDAALNDNPNFGATMTASLATNAAAILAETERAEAAESALATPAGVAAAVAVETGRAETAEAGNAAAVATETARATAAESTNATAIVANAAGIVTERTRAEAAEAAETTRAAAAEAANATNIATNSTNIAAEVARAEAAESGLAPIASPVFTGTPKAPTAAALDASTNLATSAYCDRAVAAAAFSVGASGTAVLRNAKPIPWNFQFPVPQSVPTVLSLSAVTFAPTPLFQNTYTWALVSGPSPTLGQIITITGMFNAGNNAPSLLIMAITGAGGSSGTLTVDLAGTGVTHSGDTGTGTILLGAPNTVLSISGVTFATPFNTYTWTLVSGASPAIGQVVCIAGMTTNGNNLASGQVIVGLTGAGGSSGTLTCYLSGGSTHSGDTAVGAIFTKVLYTCPANRRCLVPTYPFIVFPLNSSATMSVGIELFDASGNFYDLGIKGVGNNGGQVSLGLVSYLILEPGDSLVLSATAAANFFGGAIEFDSNSQIRFVKMVIPTNAYTTVYTAPAGGAMISAGGGLQAGAEIGFLANYVASGNMTPAVQAVIGGVTVQFGGTFNPSAAQTVGLLQNNSAGPTYWFLAAGDSLVIKPGLAPPAGVNPGVIWFGAVVNEAIS
jgi:hypothetical protein